MFLEALILACYIYIVLSMMFPLKVLTDDETGLQYLASGLFKNNLIPRLDENGKHMKVAKKD